VLLGDGVLLGDANVQAQSAQLKGDNTSSMPVVVDSTTSTSGGSTSGGTKGRK